MKKIVLILVNILVILLTINISFCDENLPKIFYNEQEYFLKDEKYLKNDEIMVNLEELANLIGVEFRWLKNNESALVGEIYIYKGLNKFKNMYITTWSDVEVEVINGKLFVPLKAICNLFLFDVQLDDEKISIKKLQSSDGKYLKLIYDKRYSGKILGREIIDEIDCSYNGEYTNVPEKYIEIFVIGSIINKDQIALVGNNETNKNSLFIEDESYVKNRYDLEVPYEIIDVKKDYNRLIFKCEEFLKNDEFQYFIEEAPIIELGESFIKKLKSFVDENTVIEVVNLDRSNRREEKVINIKKIEENKNFLLIICSSEGHNIKIKNIDNVKIKGIILNEDLHGRFNEVENINRIINCPEGIELIHTNYLGELSLVFENRVNNWLDYNEFHEDFCLKQLKDFNDKIFNLTGKNINSISFEDKFVAENGQYLINERQIESLNKYSKKVNLEISVPEYIDNGEIDSKLKILEGGNNILKAYYINDDSPDEIKELGEYNFNDFSNKIGYDELEDIISGKIYLKGNYNFSDEFEKKLDISFFKGRLKILVDGEEIVDVDDDSDEFINIPKGKHCIEIIYTSKDNGFFGFSFLLRNVMEIINDSNFDAAKNEITKDTKVYFIETLYPSKTKKTIIDLNNYSGNMALVIRTGYFGNWEIINDDKVDIKAVIFLNNRNSNLTMKDYNSKKVFNTESSKFDLKNIGIEKFENELHLSSVDAINDLYNFTQDSSNSSKIYLGDKEIKFPKLNYDPIIYPGYYFVNGDIEIISKIIGLEYKYDKNNETIQIKGNHKEYIYDINEKAWYEDAIGKRVFTFDYGFDYNGRKYFQLVNILNSFNFNAKFDLDKDEIFIDKSNADSESIITENPIPEKGFRVYIYDSVVNENKNVVTLTVDRLKDLNSYGFHYIDDKEMIIKEIVTSEGGEYIFENKLFGKFKLILDGKEYDSDESFILKKGRNILTYYFEKGVIEFDVDEFTMTKSK